MVKVSLGLAVAVFGVFAGASEARAQEPTAPSAPAPATAADVVRLKNGGLLRGTISELVPGEFVEIVTVTGERRRFEMKNVSYAGPANEMPSQEEEPEEELAGVTGTPESATKARGARPFLTVHAAEAKLHLTSEPNGLTYHLRSSTALATSSTGATAIGHGFEEMCATPCDVSLPEGSHVLAVSMPDGSPVAARPIRVPAGNSLVNANYTDNSSIRATGAAIAVLALIGGSIVMLMPVFSMDSGSSSDFDTTPIWIGAGIMTLGGAAGFALAFTSDDVTLRLRRQQEPPR